MAGTTITDLPRPTKPCRVDCDTQRYDGEVAFPTQDKARAEDATRAKLLARLSQGGFWEKRRARKLAERLDRGLRTGKSEPTLASAVYHRETRIPILSALWRAVEDVGPENVAFVTLRPKGSLIEGDRLSEFDPRLMCKRLRNDFDRVGVTAAPGFAFVGLDIEFDANRGTSGVWDFHWHGTLAGDKIAAVEGLRSMRKYQQGREHPLEHGLKPLPRVHVQQGLYNLPDPLNYCLDSWVPHRPTKLLPDGTRERSKGKRRIPTPYLEQWLLWMDRWSIKDFIVLSGMRPSPSGFIVGP